MRWDMKAINNHDSLYFIAMIDIFMNPLYSHNSTRKYNVNYEQEQLHTAAYRHEGCRAA